MTMRYTDAQALCVEAKQKYLWDSTKELVDEVVNDASYSEVPYKKEKLLEKHFRTMAVVNRVLDELSHEFWVVYEDK